jgi:hypothetical protein
MDSKNRIALGLLAALAALASCTSSQRPAPESSPAPPTDQATAEALKKHPVTRDNPCSVLFPNEVGDIVGAKMAMREVVDEVTCHYIYDEPEPGSGAERFVEIKVHWEDGQTVILAARGAGALASSETKAFEELPGIGDEAYMGPRDSLLLFRKGDVGVEIDLRMGPKGREAGVKLAKLIASRV